MTRRILWVVVAIILLMTAAMCYYAIMAGRPARAFHIEEMDR